MTPGQAAYEAWCKHPAPTSMDAWEAAAQAAIDVFVADWQSS